MKQLFFFLTLFCGFCYPSLSQTIKEVQIDDQIWMAENLNVDRFRNGDLIKEAKTYEDWKRAEVNRRPAWCYYNNDSANGAIYGKLYNFYAISDPRGLAPKGWHIPDEKEWRKLVDFLGGEKKAGKKMKSTEGWLKDGNGNNKSGFNALPGGSRYFNSEYKDLGEVGIWWKASEDYIGFHGEFIRLYNSESNVFIYNYSQHNAYSVRCLKN